MLPDYQPIACVQHEQLEFSVLRKIPLRLHYRHGSETISATVIPLDVATRDGAEWLKFCRSGESGSDEIRLDTIISFAEATSA